MKHLPTVDFLRDLARRVDEDYDSRRLEEIADGMQVAPVVDRAAPRITMGFSGADIQPGLAIARDMI